MRGLFGNLLSLIGWGSVLFVLLLGFIEASQSQGGTKEFLTKVVGDPVLVGNPPPTASPDNPYIRFERASDGTIITNGIAVVDTRSALMDLQLAAFFLTPLKQIGDYMVSIDALGVLIVLFLTMAVVWTISFIFKPGLAYIIPIFLIVFLVAAVLWTGFWLDKYFDSGTALGIDRSTLMSNLQTSEQVFQNPWMLAVLGISSAFLLYRFAFILPGVG